MIRPLRRLHLVLVVTITVLASVVAWLGLAQRQERPVAPLPEVVEASTSQSVGSP